MKVEKYPITIGRAECVSFPELGTYDIPARIDTGAGISSIWASHIEEDAKGLSFVLFDEGGEFYNGNKITVAEYSKLAVASSMGHIQIRHQTKLLIVVAGKKIRATFTLADRSTQVYPVLVGRNVLRGRFVVDVRVGKPRLDAELKRSQGLQASLNDYEKEEV